MSAEISLRDQIAAAAYPYALEAAFKGYNHLCDQVHDMANRDAYAAADSFMAYRARTAATKAGSDSPQ